MKKACLPLVLLTAVCLNTQTASAQAFQKGVNLISAGYGFGTFMGALKSAVEDDPLNSNLEFKNTGPLYFKYEYGVSDKVGFGVNFAYAKNELTYDYTGSDGNGNPRTYTETDTRDTYSILARVNFHFSDSETFDPYFGVGMGYRDANWTFKSNDPGGTRANYKTLVNFGFETTVGVRYYFAQNFGLYGEVGGAKSIFQLGLCGKF